MSKHTKGPWILGRYGAILGGDFHQYSNGKAQSQIAMATLQNWMEDGEKEENARRIVACVNSLQGVPTDVLELSLKIGITDITTGNLFSSRLNLQRKIDHLLSALNEIDKYLDNAPTVREILNSAISTMDNLNDE